MKVFSGKQAVWSHAKEVGLDDALSKISKAFDRDIADVCIIGNGKISYIRDMPRRCHRVEAIPVVIDTEKEMDRVRAPKSRFK